MYVCMHECMCVYNIYGIKRMHVSVGIHTCVHYTYMCTYDYVVYNMRTYVYFIYLFIFFFFFFIVHSCYQTILYNRK